MSKLIVMCGLPASKKSTYSKELSEKENAVIVSSDDMRKELFGDVNDQSNNQELFDKMHERINELLSQGKNVIYDSTNINRKRRMHFLKYTVKADEKVIYYMNTPMVNCLNQDSIRERKVGYDVIDRMYKNLHIPTKLEGWDKVNFVNSEHKLKKQYRELLEIHLPTDLDYKYLFEELSKVIREFDSVYEVPHDSSYHSFSISRHIYHVYKYIRNNYKGRRMLEMLFAALFHDLGKGHCKSFYNYKGEEKRYASFIGHENVSAQLAAEYLVKLGYSDELVKYVVDLVQFHMKLMNINEKQEKKLRGLLTEEQYEDLKFLHEADKSAK